MAVIRRWWDASGVDGPSASPEDYVVPTHGAPGLRPPVDDHRPGVTVFVFADIRGYTHFTSTRGAEAAAELAARFTQLATQTVQHHHGRVRGTWGDEVLAEFGSARNAIRAAVALQAGCEDATLADPTWPLGVGVGIDVGEAADTAAVTSGSALNLAARLCAKAGPGEVLATAELVHLAGAVPSVTYQPRGKAPLKGVGRVPVVRVRATSVDLRRQAKLASLMVGATERRRARRRRSLLAGITAVAVVIGTGAWWFIRGNPAAPIVPANSLGIIDTGTGRLLGAVPVGQSPQGVAVDGTDVWVVNTGENTVSRVDQHNQVVTQTVTVGEAPVALAMLGKNLWVVNSLSGTLSRVSTETGQVVGTPIQVGSEPSAIVAGFGRLWVTDQGDGQVTAIDPTGARPTQTIDVGDSPDGIAAGDGAVWVSNRVDDTVSKINPVAMTVDSLIRVGAGPAGIVAAASGIWVVNSLDLTASRIDPATDAVNHVVQVGDTPIAVAADADSVWVADAGDATVTRIDPRTGLVTERLFVGGSPRGLALVGASLLVTARGFAAATHGGGTLTISYFQGFGDSLDPAVSYSFDVWAALHLVYDGLVGLRRTTDVGGYELVPDLAQTLPIPTVDGLTYTFTLRRGIHYADGTPLMAGDVRRGIVRTFTSLTGPVHTGDPVLYYSGIEGAAACLTAPKTCNLDAGIVTDDQSRTVTFHLTRADPDFLAKLTLPFATAAPPGAPAGDFGTHPFPGTGPYQISQYTPYNEITKAKAGSLTLVRNKYFRQWSSAAQPAGFPAVIRWVFPHFAADDMAAVEQGRADATEIFGSDIAAAEENYPALTHHTTIADTRFLVLNTTRPPFKDIRARRAVAMALDRAAATNAFGDPARDAACRLVPVGYPGSQPHCPYQPDTGTALRLVKASRTGGPINLYFHKQDPNWHREATHLQKALKAIGYDATLTFEPGAYGPPGPVGKRGRPVNGYGSSWGADFPAASQYFLPLFSCSRTLLGTGGYCNRALETQARRALKAQATDPGKATELWKEVYKTLDDNAVVIPFEQPEFDVLLSPRVGNYQVSPFGIPEFDQMWVR